MSLTDEHKNHKQYNYTILNVIMKLNETKMRVLPSHICKTLSSTIEQLHSKKRLLSSSWTGDSRI